MPRLTVDTLIEKAGGVVQLGELLGVARTTVIGWRQTGLIPGNRVPQIAAAFGLSADDLLPMVQGPRSGSGSSTPLNCVAA